MQKKMTIEIRKETPAFNESFVSTIDLPALPLALRDAEQRARLPRDPDPPPEIVVISCPDLPELIDCRLDLTDDYGTAIKVGQRHGRAVVYQVSSQAMHRDGYKFFRSVNGVWLTKAVPVQYLINLSQTQKHNE